MSSNAAELGQPVPTDLRRFRLEHALQSLENTLILLDARPAEAIEISALDGFETTSLSCSGRR